MFDIDPYRHDSHCHLIAVAKRGGCRLLFILNLRLVSGSLRCGDRLPLVFERTEIVRRSVGVLLHHFCVQHRSPSERFRV